MYMLHSVALTIVENELHRSIPKGRPNEICNTLDRRIQNHMILNLERYLRKLALRVTWPSFENSTAFPEIQISNSYMPYESTINSKPVAYWTVLCVCDATSAAEILVLFGLKSAVYASQLKGSSNVEYPTVSSSIGVMRITLSQR
jgi:hypothetical protein